jgi:hypothetical protein
MFNKSLRTALMGSGAAFAMMAGPALAGQADDLQAQIDSLQSRLDQLERQKATADTPQAVAPADAVVGGDYPGSWKLPGSDTSMSIHGYIKADFYYDFNQNLGDTFADTAIAGNKSASAHQGGTFHFQSKQSRINFETRTPTDWGQLKTYLEMDFFGLVSNANNEVGGGGNTSNPPRMRHAYGQLGPVLAGQTWSNFDDPDDLPEQLDFNGGQGEMAGRQTQVRYVLPLGHWTLSAAAENPNLKVTSLTTIPAGGLTSDSIATTAGTPVGAQMNRMPDITGRIQYADTWGHVSLSGVIRDFNYNNGGAAGNSSTVASEAVKTSITANTIAGGAILGTNIAVGQWFGGPFTKDYIGLVGNAGEGIQRFFNTGAGIMPDASAVVGPTGGVTLKPMPQIGFVAWYQHWWTDNVRTNLVFGDSWYSWGGVPRAVSTGVADTSQLTRLEDGYINLIWSPVKSVNIGLEFMYGAMQKRGLGGAIGPCGSSQCGGNNGNAERLLASLQYLF